MLDPLHHGPDRPAPDFPSAVARARGVARAAGCPALLRVGGPVGIGAPLDLFELARRGARSGTYWRDPATGRASATLGGLPAAGTPLCAPAPLPGPVQVFGRAFAERAIRPGPWAAWPRRLRRVPVAALTRCSSSHEQWLALHALIAPIGDDRADAERLAARWFSLSAALLDAPAAASGEPAGAPVDEESIGSWRARVRAIVEACDHGALNKVVPARATRFEAPAGRRFSARATLAALVERHPEAHVFGFTEGHRAFVGASPELLARLDGRRLETHALAGTAPRGVDPAEDARLGAALLARDKDRREHRVVVEAITAALDPLAAAVMVDGAPRLRRLPGIQHLETAISARLRPGVALDDIVDRLHPTPALGGEPRAAALEWLARTEPLDRGWYGGPVGWLGADGAGVAAVAIRSALIVGPRAWAFAGAGVVAGSDPDAEWAESALKLRTVGQALRTVRSEDR